MPISKHFGGNGAKVMANMMKEYGTAKGKQVFYATENKKKKKKKPREAQFSVNSALTVRR